MGVGTPPLWPGDALPGRVALPDLQIRTEQHAVQRSFMRVSNSWGVMNSLMAIGVATDVDAVQAGECACSPVVINVLVAFSSCVPLAIGLIPTRLLRMGLSFARTLLLPPGPRLG